VGFFVFSGRTGHEENPPVRQTATIGAVWTRSEALAPRRG